jgi:pimeloyl-ACP methyl ester carboxylesterase
MFIYATGDDPYDEPIIYLEGGPGGAAITGYDYWYESSFREDYDIILIDQRGTGFSLPSLNCYEADEFEDYLEDCAERLRDEGIDLGAYNSIESAHDIGDLIDALELDSVNLYGISYGSRLALNIMREQPENIRSVMLEGVYPPNIRGYEEEAVAFWGALQALFEACEADDSCSSQYPDLEDTFFEAIENLNESPIEVEDYATGEYYEMDGYTFADDLYLFMYDYAWMPYLPELIYIAAEGDAEAYSEFIYTEAEEVEYSDEYYDALDEAFMDYLGFDDYDEMYDYIDSRSDDEYFEIEDAILGYIDDDSEGMFTSNECFEEIPFNTLEGFDERSRDVPELLVEYTALSIDATFADCAIWDIPAADDEMKDLVRSDIPTLIISGELDPVTPAYWGEAAAEGFAKQLPLCLSRDGAWCY